MSDGNFSVVLTADRTMMAAYPLLLDGMGAAAQTTFTPSPIMTRLIARRVACDGVRARQAPLGLRRIEAALQRGGMAAEDVAIVPPEKLGRAIGPRTRVVGISSGDPLGIGMNSTTMTGVFGGQPYTSTRFQALVRQARGIVQRAGAEARIVAGGPGMWQLRGNEAARRELGIDHVICGYAEAEVAALFGRITASGAVDEVVEARWGRHDEIPPIAGPTVMGMVEASRGCGWGCEFCTLAGVAMTHLSADAVVADVETNLRAGVENISLGSEDIFRYGAEPSERARPEALIGLLDRLRGLGDVRSLAIDHANIATISAYTDEELEAVHERLSGGRRGHLVWLNVGVETASGELLEASGGTLKMRPFGAEEWPERCLHEIRRLASHGFLPMISLVVGLPGETPQDTRRTRDWVRSLESDRVTIVPVLHTGVREGGERIAADEVTPLQWEIFERSLGLTFRWMPRLYWDHHGLAGVATWRRVMMQVFGRCYAPYWRLMVRRRKARAVRR